MDAFKVPLDRPRPALNPRKAHWQLQQQHVDNEVTPDLIRLSYAQATSPPRPGLDLGSASASPSDTVSVPSDTVRLALNNAVLYELVWAG
jgi:hypothetical protein